MRGVKQEISTLINKLPEFLFWFIGLNATLNVFRYGLRPVMLLYTAALCGLALYTIARILFRRAALSSPLMLLRILSLGLALLVSASYSGGFFLRNLRDLLPVFLVFAIILAEPYESHCRSFYSGYRLSLIITMVYAGVQLVILKTAGVNITKYLVSALRLGTFSTLEEGRLTGLCWDPYLLGIFCATGFFLFRSRWIRAYLLVLLYFSGSRAGQLGLLLALFVLLLPELLKRKWILYAACAGVIALLLLPRVLHLGRGFNRESLGYRRIEYITLLPEVEEKDGSVVRFLTGGAPAYSGARFYYSGVKSLTNDTTPFAEWKIESDWIGILYGRGLLGMIVYFWFFLDLIRRQRDRSLRGLVLAVFFAGIGYYFESAVFINLLIMLPLYRKQEMTVTGKNAADRTGSIQAA